MRRHIRRDVPTLLGWKTFHICRTYTIFWCHFWTPLYDLVDYGKPKFICVCCLLSVIITAIIYPGYTINSNLIFMTRKINCVHIKNNIFIANSVKAQNINRNSALRSWYFLFWCFKYLLQMKRYKYEQGIYETAAVIISVFTFLLSFRTWL